MGAGLAGLAQRGRPALPVALLPPENHRRKLTHNVKLLQCHRRLQNDKAPQNCSPILVPFSKVTFSFLKQSGVDTLRCCPNNCLCILTI